MKRINVKISTPTLIIMMMIVIGVHAFIFSTRNEIKACDESYHFINPRMACSNNIVVGKEEYAETRSKIQELINENKAGGKVDDVAVWFRDLEFGPTLGINQQRDFIPASLLKLPLAIAIFQLAEDNPALLSKELTYNKYSEVPNQNFSPEESIIIGRTYTIEELTRRIIVYSDNLAAQLLYEFILTYKDNPLSSLYRDLGILEPGSDLDAPVLNAKGYGAVLRVLYNSSFLNKEYSEKILNWLSQTQFNEGLRKGVPKDIPIAHKFGERVRDDGIKQLHDCGIIYYPGNPYLLCIMTKGKDFGELSNIIGRISEEIYKEFDSRNINNNE